MNESTIPSVATPKTQRSNVKVSFPMERELHHEITAALTELSTQLGFEVTMPKFLRKMVVEGWKTQLDRFRRLDVNPRK